MWDKGARRLAERGRGKENVDQRCVWCVFGVCFVCVWCVFGVCLVVLWVCGVCACGLTRVVRVEPIIRFKHPQPLRELVPRQARPPITQHVKDDKLRPPTLSVDNDLPIKHSPRRDALRQLQERIPARVVSRRNRRPPLHRPIQQHRTRSRKDHQIANPVRLLTDVIIALLHRLQVMPLETNRHTTHEPLLHRRQTRPMTVLNRRVKRRQPSFRVPPNSPALPLCNVNRVLVLVHVQKLTYVQVTLNRREMVQHPNELLGKVCYCRGNTLPLSSGGIRH